MAFKLVISNPKDGKAYQIETDADQSLIGKKVGEQIDGAPFGLSGYTLEITGGSDHIGDPIRPDVSGAASKRLLLSGGVGFNPTRDGERRKKRVHGKTIAPDIVQVNLKVVKAGGKKLADLIGKKEETEGASEEAAPEEKKEEVKEAPAEEPKEEAPEEKKVEEKAEEAPKEEKKEAPAEKPKEEAPEEKKEDTKEAPAEEKKEGESE